MSEDTKLGDRLTFLRELAKGLNLNIDIARKQLFDEIALESQFDNPDKQDTVTDVAEKPAPEAKVKQSLKKSKFFRGK